MAQVAKVAGGGLRFHDLRHSYATWLITEGMAVNVVRKVMGHEQMSTTLDIYTNSRELHQAGANPQVAMSGRPISATHLGQRLKHLGIQPGQARSTALFQLATQLPAALLARILGIHIGVAVARQHASAGDWTNYAADVSRRPRIGSPT